MRKERTKSYFIAHHPGDPRYWVHYPFLTDGVLMSQRSIHTRRTGRPSALLKEMEVNGVHQTLQLPRNVPFILDSGAFQFIGPEWKELPLDPNDVLEVYKSLKVDIGVHLDWPIFPGLDKREATKRYRTTLENAAITMELLQEGGYGSLNIIGVVQGTSPTMYAQCAKKLIALGYTLIGIGGIAPLSRGTNLREIKKRILAVTRITAQRDDLKVHLFGVGNFEVLNAVLDYGVDSFDNATPTMAAIKGDVILSNPYGRYNIVRDGTRAHREIPCGCPACAEFGRKILTRGSRKVNFARAVHNYVHYVDSLLGVQTIQAN